jgi:DNA-binding response OmpR family regulator
MNRAIRVIVGDDDANDRFFLQRAFQKIYPDVTVDFARNGEEVIRFLKDDSQPVPSLLLIDSMMTKINGFDVLEWLRPQRQFQQLPVVMLTGQLSDANATRAREYGVKAYLTKPEDMTGLEVLVKDLGEKFLKPTT